MENSFFMQMGGTYQQLGDYPTFPLQKVSLLAFGDNGGNTT